MVVMGRGRARWRTTDELVEREYPDLLDASGAARLARILVARGLTDEDPVVELGDDEWHDARSELDERLRYDRDPLPMLDALVAAASGDEAALDLLGAGAVEDLLGWRPDLWPGLAARCRSDASWARAAQGAWTSDEVHDRLPEPLRSLVLANGPENPVAQRTKVPKAKRTTRAASAQTRARRAGRRA